MGSPTKDKAQWPGADEETHMVTGTTEVSENGLYTSGKLTIIWYYIYI